MRMSAIKVGQTYAISNQRDAVPGTPGWSFVAGIVREKNVARPDDEKVSRVYRNPGESRTDAVVVDVVDPADLTHVVRTEIIRTRDVKSEWAEHAALLAKNVERVQKEHEREQIEAERVGREVARIAGDWLSAAEVAAATSPRNLSQALSADVERLSDSLVVVRQNRGDAVVLVLDEDVYTDLVDDQSPRGARGAKVSRLTVVGGSATEWTLLAAAAALSAEQDVASAAV